MQNNYLIVDKRILPDYYEKVVEARTMLRDGAVKEVSEAVRIVGISRSTYYKYKDYIFSPGTDDTACKKAVLSLMLGHEKGVLCEVLNELSALGGNILTITQSLPIQGRASVVISLDMSHMNIEVQELLDRLGKLRQVSSIKLLAIE